MKWLAYIGIREGGGREAQLNTRVGEFRIGIRYDNQNDFVSGRVCFDMLNGCLS